MVEKWTEIKQRLEAKLFFTPPELEFLDALAAGTVDRSFSTGDMFADRLTLLNLFAQFDSKLKPGVIQLLCQFFYDHASIPLRVASDQTDGVSLPEYLHAKAKLKLLLTDDGVFANWKEIFEAERARVDSNP